MVFMLKNIFYLIVILNFYVLIGNVTSEVFTALTDMKHLLKLESNLITHLSRFMARQEHKLDHLNGRLKEYTNLNDKTFKNIPEFVSKPTNKFLIIKRLFNDWGITLTNLINDEPHNKYFSRTKNIYNKTQFPKSEDLNGAAIALSRLQQTYKLNASDLANGIILGVQYPSKMTATDCYIVGLETLKNKIYHHAEMWFNEAWKRLELPINESQQLFQIYILIGLASAHKKQGNFEKALEFIKSAIEIDPNNNQAKTLENRITAEMAKVNRKESRTSIQHKMNQLIENEFYSLNYNPMDHINPDEPSHYEQLLYEAVCRGDVKPTPKQLAPFRCRYLSNKSAFLKMAPFKLEEISLDPYIVIYHDVISNEEIEVVKSIARQKLKRAGVDNAGELNFVDYRISKAAWLKDHHHKYVADITNRVKDMTGFTMDSAEYLQVVNYGIGGFYDTHLDYAPIGDTTYDEAGVGNRIGTVMFYMSDVKEGGATSFHMIKTAIVPQKGAAIYWLNLHANGTGDPRTKHAGCPVLVGNKWVSNKWLHVVGQEFIRPCGLHPNHIDTY